MNNGARMKIHPTEMHQPVKKDVIKSNPYRRIFDAVVNAEFGEGESSIDPWFKCREVNGRVKSPAKNNAKGTLKDNNFALGFCLKICLLTSIRNAVTLDGKNNAGDREVINADRGEFVVCIHI